MVSTSTTTTTPTTARPKCACNTCKLPLCTCVTEVCEVDVSGVSGQTIKTSKLQQTLLTEMLVDSIACGDAELRKILEENAADALCISGGCGQHIRFLNAQLHLLDIAMFFARNKVDEFKSRSNSEGNERFRSESRSESSAQRTAQGTSCAFQDQSSFQQFQRDSVDRFRSQSDMSASSEGQSQTTRTDRSTQSASGYSSVNDFSESASVGRGNGQSQTQDISSSRSYSKTFPGFGPALNDLSTGTGVALVVADPGNITFTITPPFINIDLPTVAFEYDSGDSLVGDFNNPGVLPLPDCPPLSCRPEDYDQLTGYPSFGRGYNVHYTASIGVLVAGSISVDFRDAESFRQQDILSQRCSSSIGTSFTLNVYDQTDESLSRGTTDTHDESATDRNIVTIGDSVRDAVSNTTAGSATTGDAHSESHSGADRQQHSEGQSSNQGTALSESHSEADGLSTVSSRIDAQSRKFSQIFDALKDMWKLVLEEIKIAQLEQNSTLGTRIHAIVGGQCVAIPPDPILLRSPGRSQHGF